MRKTTNLYSKDFKFMILGQVISIFGAALLRFALSLYILDITGRADMFAVLYAISNIPFLLSPLGGAIADRFNRRNLMVIFDFTSSVVVMCLFLLVSMELATVITIGIIMVLLSMISALYTPTVTASIPLLVVNEQLEGANGIVQAVQALSGITAPIFGGILYGVFELRFLIIISCIAFFLSAVMETFIKIPFAKRERDGHIITTIAKDMKEGFTYVVKQSFILNSAIIAAVMNLALSPLLIVGSPIILRVTMQSSDIMQGVGVGLISFASILGTLTIGAFAKRIEMNTLYRLIAAIALLVVPIAVSVLPFILELGYYPAFVLFLFGAILIAMFTTIITILMIARVQRVTENENLGKVMAIMMAFAQCAAPLGQVIYGVVFESFSEALYFPILIVGLLMIVIAFVARRMFAAEPINQLE